MNPKPRRAQGGLGLLSRSISVHELKNSSLTSWAKEEREEEQRGRERGDGREVAPGGESVLFRCRERREE